MMYSLYVICCFVTFGSVLSFSELLFETHNKCGCFSYDKCPNFYTPNCSMETDNYEELYLQNSASSDSPEFCSQWFLKGFKKQLIVSENGNLEISIMFSPMLNQKINLIIELRYQDQCSDISSSNSFELLGNNHSTKYVTVHGRYTESCQKAIKINFPYVFSGCYQVYIKKKNSGSSSGCMSRPFLLTSSYKKETLDNITVKHMPSYVGQSEYLKFSYVGEGLNKPKSILIRLLNIDIGGSDSLVKEAHLTSELVFTSVFGYFPHGLKPFSTAVTLKSDVDLSLDDCAGSGNKATRYVLAQRGECCHGLEHPNNSEPHNMTYCPCKWENDATLKCRFQEIKNGNYCVILRLIDPRCDKTTLWTKLDCAWSFNIEAKGQITPTEIEPYQVNNLYNMVILCCVFVIVVTASVMLTILYFKKEKKNKHTFPIEKIVEQPFLISEEEEILLLYPRDCERFMTAMALFRMLLKESCGCKVHDAWDEEIYDKVAESIETWSLPLIHNENTKVIVVLTECSKIIEESYIGGNNFATYRDPKAFDKIFAQSIKALIEYFATRFDTYRRVFVVRLDETPVVDFSFHFNRATVYILPHGLQTLVNDLQNGNSTPINKESHLRLKTAIHEYQVYRLQYVNYLNDILNINNNCKITKCLKNGMSR